jgi:V8-like Glu-specific endopeptidase
MGSIMAPQHIGRRALLPVLGLGVCLVGMTAAAHAQDLLFSKQLNLSLNPTPPQSAAEDAKAIDAEVPPPPETKGFYETELKLRSLSEAPDGEGRTARVIQGTPSKAGYWKSAVNLEIGRGLSGPVMCGASIVGQRWVLTAAHCVFDDKKGGLRPLEWITVYEGSHQHKRGRAVRIVEVHVHKQFKVTNNQLVYDLALLRLEKDAQAPRQKLVSYQSVSSFLKPGTTATVVGWGNTQPTGFKPSSVLLQANVPVVATPTCHSIYPDVGQVAFCAGYPQGGTDTCQGDSGGPLYLAGANGEHVQAGITSFGKGCAQPNAYGVYTNLGLFEQWIKDIVPDPYFVGAPSTQAGSHLSEIAGVKPGGPPSPHGQVSVDIKQVPCASQGSPFGTGKSANQIKAGACIRVFVTSGVTGHLRVMSINAKGKVDTIFPNEHVVPSGQVGATDGHVKAGKTIALPGIGDSFGFHVSAPYGTAHVVAIVASEEVGLPKIAKGRGLQRSTEELVDELAEIARQINVHPLAPRAVGTRQYQVVE